MKKTTLRQSAVLTMLAGLATAEAVFAQVSTPTSEAPLFLRCSASLTYYKFEDATFVRSGSSGHNISGVYNYTFKFNGSDVSRWDSRSATWVDGAGYSATQTQYSFVRQSRMYEFSNYTERRYLEFRNIINRSTGRFRMINDYVDRNGVREDFIRLEGSCSPTTNPEATVARPAF